MRVLSWNILHGGGGRREAILAAIAAIDPDLVTLQEVRRSEGRDPLREGLADLGLGEQVLSPLGDARSNGVLIASRWPLSAEPLRPVDPSADPASPVYLMKARLSWPGRATGPAPGEGDGGSQGEEEGGAELLNLVAVRFPQKQAQIAPFEALLALPPAWRAELSLLIGDFNCGIPLFDSQTRTFPCTAWFQRLLAQGWVDAWRRRHPQEREYSWFSASRGNGFRYDHALASPSLDARIRSVRYAQELRVAGLSDHAGLVVELG
jgi:exodeoxyribonuclease-3